MVEIRLYKEFKESVEFQPFQNSHVLVNFFENLPLLNGFILNFLGTVIRKKNNILIFSIKIPN